MTEQHVRRRVWIEGQVQGVGFRWFTMSAARKVGLVGWVENRSDGRVVCEAQGGAAEMETFMQVVGAGPPHARVDRVTIEDIDPAAQPELEFDLRVHGAG